MKEKYPNTRRKFAVIFYFKAIRRVTFFIIYCLQTTASAGAFLEFKVKKPMNRDDVQYPPQLVFANQSTPLF